MDKKSLKARGGFVSGKPIKRSVEWAHVTPEGEDVVDKFDIYIYPRSAGVMNQIRTLAKEGKDERLLTISACVGLGIDGQERISYEEAQELDDGLQLVLVSAVMLFWAAKADPKNSPPPTNSGTTSPDSSAAAPSLS